MGYFIITDSNWAKLRNAILNLAETCHKAFGSRASIPIGCTMVMYASCSTSASAHCSITGIQVYFHSLRSGISAITGVRMWSYCSKQKRRKLKQEN